MSKDKSPNVNGRSEPSKPLCTGDVVVAIDPGVTTGVIAVRYTGGIEYDVLTSDTLEWDDTMIGLHRFLALWRPAHTITERFSLYSDHAKAQIGNEFPSSQVIGAARLSLQLLGLEALVFQSASLRKSAKVLSEHQRVIGTITHRVDAYLHARYFIIMSVRRALRAAKLRGA